MLSTKSMRRLLEKYQRWFLIGLVVFLLVIFTVLDSIGSQVGASGVEREGPDPDDVAGSFAVLPGARAYVTWKEFNDARNRVAIATLLRRGGSDLPPATAVWPFLVLLAAADREGIEISDRELVRELEQTWQIDFDDPLLYGRYKDALTRFRTTANTYENCVRDLMKARRMRDVYRQAFMTAPAASRDALVDEYLVRAPENVLLSWAALDAKHSLDEAAAVLKAETDSERSLRKFFEGSPEVKRERIRFRHQRRYTFELLYTVHKHMKTEGDWQRVLALFEKAFPGHDERATAGPKIDEIDSYWGLYRERLLDQQFGKKLAELEVTVEKKEEEKEEEGDEDGDEEKDEPEEKEGPDEFDPDLHQARLDRSKDLLTKEDGTDETGQVQREIRLRHMYEYLQRVAAKNDSKSLNEIFNKLRKHDDADNPVCSTEPGRGIIVYREGLTPMTGEELALVEDDGIVFTHNFRHRIVDTARYMKEGAPKVGRKADILGNGGQGRMIWRLLKVEQERPKTFEELTDGEKEVLRDEFYLPDAARKLTTAAMEKLRKRCTAEDFKQEAFPEEARTIGCRVIVKEWIDADPQFRPEPDRKTLWPDAYAHMRDRRALRRDLSSQLRKAGADEITPGTFLEVYSRTRLDPEDPGTAYLALVLERNKPTPESIPEEKLDAQLNRRQLLRMTEENRWWDNFLRMKIQFFMDFHEDMQETLDEEAAKSGATGVPGRLPG